MNIVIIGTGHSLIIYREELDLTLPNVDREGLIMKRMAVLHQNSGDPPPWASGMHFPIPPSF